jgi:hypothetical protein
VDVGTALSKVKAPCPLEAEVEVPLTEVEEDMGRSVEPTDGGNVGVEDPRALGDIGAAVEETMVVAGDINPALARVADEEAPVSETDVPLWGILAPAAVTVTVVVTVTVGSPFVPMAVWIEAGSAKVLLEVGGEVEAGRAGVEVGGAEMDAGDAEVEVEDEEVTGDMVEVVEVLGGGVLAGTVTKVILLNWRLWSWVVVDVGTVEVDGVPSSQS